MLLVAAMLSALWLAGLFTAHTMNGLIHVLALAAAVMIMVRFAELRRDA